MNFNQKTLLIPTYLHTYIHYEWHVQYLMYNNQSTYLPTYIQYVHTRKASTNVETNYLL